MGQNEMTEGAGLNLILSKRFGVVGAPAPLMASEVFPNVVLEIDRPEWPFLAGNRIAGGTVNDGAVVGEISHVGLHNPASSGILVIVHEVSIIVATNDARFFLEVGTTVDAKDSFGPGVPRDTRFRMRGAGGPETTANIWQLTQVGTITGARIADLSGSTNFDMVKYPQPIVLGEDGFVLVRGAVVNQQVIANFVWTEQLASSGEFQGARV